MPLQQDRKFKIAARKITNSIQFYRQILINFTLCLKKNNSIITENI